MKTNKKAIQAGLKHRTNTLLALSLFLALLASTTASPTTKASEEIPQEAEPTIHYSIHNLDHFDAYSYIVLCPLGILTSLGLFLGHIFSKELRKSPGDLVMMVAFADLLLSIHWFSSAIHTYYFAGADKDPVGGGYSTFCIAEAYVAVFAASIEGVYNVAFIVFILLRVRNLNMKKLSTVYFHALAVGFGTFMLVYQSLKGNIGRSQYGSCSMVKTSAVGLSFGVALMLTIIVLGTYVIWYTLRVLPQHTKELADLKRNFVNFYKRYILFIICLWSLILFTFLCQNIGKNENDYVLGVPIHPTFKGILFNLGKLGNLSKAMTGTLLFYARLSDPLIKHNIWYPFKSTLKKLKGEATPQQAKELRSELASNTNDLMWINMLSTKLKESLHRTLMGCIAAYYPDILNQRFDKDAPLSKKDSQDLLIIDVKADALMKQYKLPEDKPLMNCTFTVYAPRMFARVVSTFFKPINFAKSLCIFENDAKIKKFAENKDGQGGKSGEFFFLSHDRRIILKTTNEKEAAVFIKILHSYTTHFTQMPTSQIGRIFGLFDVNFEDAGRSVKLFVMEALDPLYKNSILRKYDLKGSTVNRSCLESYDGVDIESKISTVMKDNDFEEIEDQIELNDQARSSLINSLSADVAFFKMHKIIDYSLIISVVDMTELPPNYLIDELRSRNHHIFKCAKHSNLCYFIGVIDYFQLFDFNKALERFAKKVMKCNLKLDTSAQPPKKYGERFKNKMGEYFIERLNTETSITGSGGTGGTGGEEEDQERLIGRIGGADGGSGGERGLIEG